MVALVAGLQGGIAVADAALAGIPCSRTSVIGAAEFEAMKRGGIIAGNWRSAAFCNIYCGEMRFLQS